MRFVVKNFRQQSQNFLAVTDTKPSKPVYNQQQPLRFSMNEIIVELHKKDYILCHNTQSKPAKWYSW